MSVEREIASQPECWRRAAATTVAGLPRPGERVAVAGCGTSLYMAEAYAALREAAGQGETDAFPASEFPLGRRYDRLVAITRSGTTTEVLDLLERVDAPTVTLTGDALPFADEESVVQTRFATSALALLRASLGEDLGPAIAGAGAALTAPLPLGRSQFTFLGSGWTVGLAREGALKLREAALAWAEAYPAMEYRHGPIAIADERSLVWLLGPAPEGLVAQIEATGALVIESSGDPMAELVRIQRLAVALARERGLDPDKPRHLTRSVVLR
jgi:fructoselysine-6-P-deglycase FrlB-like protein